MSGACESRRYTLTDPAGVPAQPAWTCSDCAQTSRHPVVIDRQAHEAWHDQGGDGTPAAEEP